MAIRQEEAGTPGPTGMPAGQTATALTRRRSHDHRIP